MSSMLPDVRQELFRSELPLHARTFNALGMAGAAAGVLAGLWSLVLGSIWNAVLGFGAAILAGLLMSFAHRVDCYRRASLIVVIGVFLIGFPAMFFTGGGYFSGMPVFFLMALLFTVFLLDHPIRGLYLGLELLSYISCCLIAFFIPESVIRLSSTAAEFADVVFALIVCGGLLLILALLVTSSTVSQPAPAVVAIPSENPAAAPATQPTPPTADLNLDHLSLRAFHNGRDLLLSPKEFALLTLFMANPGRTISYAEIASKVWKADTAATIPAMQRAVSKLRLRLLDAGLTELQFKSTRGRGYAFCPIESDHLV
jgi:hypothetical protein